MTTQPVEFLPGDRVRYANSGFSGFGKLGTVVVPESVNKAGAFLPSSLPVKMDDEPNPDFYIRANFEHQPIEPGCWVRSVKPGCAEITHKIVEIGPRWLWSERTPTQSNPDPRVKLDPSCFVRIADPKPAPAVAPAPVELIAGQYLPGDRVFTTTASPNQFGTIGNLDQYGRVTMKWNNNPDAPWTLESVRQFFRREPVKVGSYVRLHQTVAKRGFDCFTYIGQIDRIVGTPTLKVAVIGGAGYPLADLVSVAKPEKVVTGSVSVGGVKFETFNDDTTRVSIPAIRIEPVNVGDEPLATRLFLWSRVGSGSVEHCRDAELASQAIEEAAKIMQMFEPGFLVGATEWLTKYAPDKLPKPPVFKRGDLVDANQGDKMVPVRGRIVTFGNKSVEIIGRYGDFYTVDFDQMKHAVE